MDTGDTLQKRRPDTAEPVWYRLQARPKHEHIAAAHRRMLDGVTIFCPRIRFKRPTRQGLVWVTEAMFPGYLFAQFELATVHRQVRYAHGISDIVHFGDRYPVVDAEASALLRNHAGLTGVEELHDELSEGDRLTIVDGAFLALDALVTPVLPAKQRAKVLMDFLSRKMEAEVESSSVLPQVAQGVDGPMDLTAPAPFGPVVPGPRAALAGALQGACLQHRRARRRRCTAGRHVQHGPQIVDQGLKDSAAIQRRACWCTAAQGRKPCGISRQGAPARSITQSMALRTSRKGCQRWRHSPGNTVRYGAAKAHPSSEAFTGIGLSARLGHPALPLLVHPRL
jgi:transcriptional antiterminator RfaH